MERAMKRCFFLIIAIMMVHLECLAQWSECFNYKGSWSKWSKVFGGELSHYHDESGIVLTTSGGLTYFKFQINNYVPPTKRERKDHLKSGKWFAYTGIVEYSVNDMLPTAEAIAKAARFVKPDPRNDLTPTVQRRTSCTIKVAPYKALPSCYAVYFDGIGVGIDIQGVSFQGEKKRIRPGRVIGNILQTVILFPVGIGSWWWTPIKEGR